MLLRAFSLFTMFEECVVISVNHFQNGSGTKAVLAPTNPECGLTSCFAGNRNLPFLVKCEDGAVYCT